MVATLTEVSRRKGKNLPQRVVAGGVGVESFGGTGGGVSGVSLFIAGEVGIELVSGEPKSKCVSVNERL